MIVFVFFLAVTCQECFFTSTLRNEFPLHITLLLCEMKSVQEGIQIYGQPLTVEAACDYCDGTIDNTGRFLKGKEPKEKDNEEPQKEHLPEELVVQKNRSKVESRSIRNTPPFLLVHLNRFQKSEASDSGEKDKKEVTVNSQVNFGSKIYNLVGMIIHHGDSMVSGHYTAFCRSVQNGIARWHSYNDNTVGAY